LKNLSVLQAVDRLILEIRRDSEEFPRRIEALREEIAAEKAELEEKEQKLKRMNLDRRELERVLEEQEQKIGREKDKLMTVKTNKEYQAVLKEIDTLKLDTEEREYRVLHLMEEIEEFEKEAARAGEKFKESEKKAMEEVVKLEAQVDGFDGKLVQTQEKHEDIASRLDPEILKKYHYLQKRHPANAVAHVRKGICQGCNTKIPPQLYNLIIANEDLYTCPNCHRILLYDDQVDG
jgi:hypothetical protein